MAGWSDIIGGAISTYADQIAVTVKTNFGPAVTVYDGRAEGAGIGALIGLEYSVTITDGRGGVVAQYGEPPATDPVRAAALIIAGYLLLTIIIRGLR